MNLSALPDLGKLLVHPLVNGHASRWAQIINLLGSSELADLTYDSPAMTQALFADGAHLLHDVIHTLRGGANCRGGSMLERLSLSNSPQDKKKRAKLKNTDIIGAQLGEPLVGAILATASAGTTVTRGPRWDGVSSEVDLMVQMEAPTEASTVTLSRLLLGHGAGGQAPLEVKTHFICDFDGRTGNAGAEIKCAYSKAEWKDRLQNAHALLVWVEPLQAAVLLVASVGQLAPGFEAPPPKATKEELKAYLASQTAQLGQPLHSQCKKLGGRCGSKANGNPHNAVVCPEARPSPLTHRVTTHCPPPTSPLLPVIATEWKKRDPDDESADDEHLFIGYTICKSCSYLHSTAEETNYLMRRMLSPFIAIGFRPAVHITLDWAHIHGAPAVSS